MKISILTPDLSHNCLGRAWLLGKILQRHYEIEIIGPALKGSIWPPLANEKINYKIIKANSPLQFLLNKKKILDEIDGDVIYASKPRATSLAIGILKKKRDKTPLILDVDDWELGLYFGRQKTFTKKIKNLFKDSLFFFKDPNSYWRILAEEKQIKSVDQITVSNHFLQKKYGGTIIWHARDTESFDPKKFNKGSIRKKYKIDKNEKIVMFFGTPRPHKGLEDLIKAVALTKKTNLTIIIVGIDRDKYSRELTRKGKKKLKEKIRFYGLQPFKKVPEFLTIADLIVIPQQKNPATIGQVPAKVFDAMAMAKPIIATRVSDLPEILDSCGWIVEPENPKQLTKTIQYVLSNPKEADKMGQKARQKCIEKYSWDAMEKLLVEVFKKYE